MTLRTLNYGSYGIFLIMGNAGFCPSTVFRDIGVPYFRKLLWVVVKIRVSFWVPYDNTAPNI